MTFEIGFVFVTLAITVALFISDRLRLDLVAVMALLALSLAGILTPAEAAAGFGDTTVILIAALFVVGEGLFQTGVAASMGRWLGRVAGTSERRILMTMMLVVAPLSAFISSTGTVAIMLPVVVSVARRAGISPSKLLIPMAYAALIGGMLTLIGTPPNIIASDALVAAGRDPLPFFGVTPIGVLVLIIALGFLLLGGRKLLPERIDASRPRSSGPSPLTPNELATAYGVSEILLQLRVKPDSPLIGVTFGEAGLRQRYGITILASHPWPAGRPQPGQARVVGADARFAAGDLLVVEAHPEQAQRLAASQGFELLAEPVGDGPLGPGLLMLEVALTPRSRFIDQTIVDSMVRSRFGVNVLGVQRLGEPLEGDYARQPLRFGDTMLVAGPSATLAPLVREQRFYGDFVVATVPQEIAGHAEERLSPRAPVALVITLIMLVIMAFNWLPTMIAALLAAVALVLTGCVKVNDVYRRMSWESLVLIAAMLPMATALTKTGGSALIATGLVTAIGPFGALALLAGIFVLTTLFSQFISNTATAVLLMPIALQAAASLGINPEPLLVTVAIAASTAFATPIASPVNTLVLAPGGYRFSDYARVGVPLQVLVLFVCLLLVPVLFPF
ncbi:MAG: SLC13 family permease [Oscillochloridaceae bacterium umkhey_bin13]